MPIDYIDLSSPKKNNKNKRIICIVVTCLSITLVSAVLLKLIYSRIFTPPPVVHTQVQRPKNQLTTKIQSLIKQFKLNINKPKHPEVLYTENSMQPKITSDKKGRYLLHINQYLHAEDAEKLQQKLTKLNYPASMDKLSKNNESFYVIYIGPYPTLSRLYNAYNQIKKQELITSPVFNTNISNKKTSNLNETIKQKIKTQLTNLKESKS